MLVDNMPDRYSPRDELALRQGEDKYRILIENSLQGIAVYQDGRFVFCNTVFAEMTGYSVEELLALTGKVRESIIHIDDQRAVQSRYECRGVRKNGSLFWMEVLSSLIEYGGGSAMQLTCIDITERKNAEEAAIEAGERLKLALEAAGMTIWDLDMQTGAVKDDHRWLQSMGYETGEVEPNISAWNSLVHPDDLPSMLKAADDHIAGKTPIYEIEHRLRHKSGSWSWILNRGRVVSRDKSGNPLRCVGIHFDVTEHRLAVEQLNQLANEQKAILNTINLGISYLKDRSIQWSNPAFLRMFGYEESELREMDVAAFYSSAEDHETDSRAAHSIMSSGAVYSIEKLLRRKDGTPLWCNVSGQAIDNANVNGGSIWIFQDVTERRRTQDALRENEEKFRRLLHNSNDIISILDARGVLTYASGPIARILGFMPGELLGKDVLAYIHPDDIGSAQKAIDELIKKPGGLRRLELRYRHKDGHWVPVEVVGTNLLHDPAAQGIVLNVRDISERNRLQEQLQQAMKMEAVGVLAGGVAHDFNNLLSVINGYSELLMESMGPNDPRRVDLEQISKAGQRAASLTSQLLAFSRKQILQPEVLNLDEVVSDLGKMLRRLIGEDIKLTTIASSCPGTINADPGQIQQIIMNLAVNARDAMPEGGMLTIETANIDFDEDYSRSHPMVPQGPYVMLAISDNGIGMDPATQAHIFEPFFTTKEKGKGTGLGLSTVYGIVKQSNGYIEVYSEPGKGTTFKIYLPRLQGRPLRSSEQVIADRNLRGTETILIAEDERSVRSLAGRILRERGYNVLQAEDGREALSIAKEYGGKIDLILTDVVMPGMNGRTLVQQLENIRPGIRSLFVSGYTDNAIVNHGLLDSNIAFLQKPFTVEKLLRKIRELLESDS